jgi:NADH-quinone oxidoreductase subunit L
MSSLSLIVALPLCGFAVNGLIGSRLPKRLVAAIACVLPGLAFAETCRIFLQLGATGAPITETLFTWVSIPGLTIDAALYFDQIAAVMCLVVTGVGTLIHIYSIGYMFHDRSFARYFAYLNLFLFFMLMLVLGKNLVVLFVGWEGVGLASYLLIGFWFEDREKTAAGLKAFIVNRVGDTGFVLAAFLIYGIVGSLDFQVINAFFAGTPAANRPSAAVTAAIGLLLLIGACGKSAQIPLHVWLPDAMAGPTPVSALIHAATMVTAGVYLLARLSGLYLASPAAMSTVAWVGALTALLGATMAVTQFNLKKVLAYSTISQIGLMVMACGLSAFSVGLFHLTTHAFFKAGLFLGAGAVLHALQGEEDMRNMGALAKKLPFTFVTFLVATLALCGIPPFSGFFSKDEILWNAWSAANGSLGLWLVALTASGLTAFYMFRAVFLTFFGASRVPDKLIAHVHEPPLSMSSVLVVLAFGALLAGFVGLPQAWVEIAHLPAPFYDFLAPVLPPIGAEHHAIVTEFALMAIAVLVAIAGIYFAWIRFGSHVQRPLAAESSRGYVHWVVSRGYFFDSFYEGVIVRVMDWLSASVLAHGLEATLAKITLAKSADITRYVSTLFARLQTGNLQTYAFYVLLGLALTLWWGAKHA